MRPACLLVSFLFVPALAQAVDVCDSGCDYTTLTSAYSAASCGDTIEMAEETTTGSPLSYVLAKTCTLGNELTIVAAAGVTPEFTDTSAAWNDGLFNISGDYHVLDGLIIRGIRLGSAVRFAAGGDHNTIQNFELYDICTDKYPTGNDCTSVLILGDFNTVQDTIFGAGCDHDAVGSYGGNYNKILNNTITCDHGHGVSLNFDADYNLVEGNDITDTGTLCTGDANCTGKMPFQISGGSNNSVRKNVAYDQLNRIIEVNVISGVNPNANDNIIYNNTFYNITTSGEAGSNDAFHLSVSDAGTTEHCEDNLVVNNIMDKVAQQVYSDFNNFNVAVMFYYTVEQDLGDDLTALATTNDWRGNHLKNNVIRPYYSGQYQLSTANAIAYSNAGNGYQPTWTVAAINGVGSHTGNITTDPLFVSTNTASFEWWHLQSGSALIDGGITVSDTNGSYVETNFPGFGWSDLTYVGSAPDIGAFEFPAIASDFSGTTISGGTVQ